MSTVGLSPLARGNLRLHGRGIASGGPIPARAGEPLGWRCAGTRSRAYPRSRGGTVSRVGAVGLGQGLSPLARGNLKPAIEAQYSHGPIPARAGEPTRSTCTSEPVRAYPRSRGETVNMDPTDLARMGLSPLARGNHRRNRHQHRRPGPIPARAGEPSMCCRTPRRTRAYPRSRGGTEAAEAGDDWDKGLSPLARGNLRRDAAGPERHGPIPARAGEPRCAAPAGRGARAYPRSRGGTESARGRVRRDRGLSPLARGNHAGHRCLHGRIGPIPARAGEPRARRPATRCRRAYPRSRGGTERINQQNLMYQGLSPLARGNPHVMRRHIGQQGPIPARAGEPSLDSRISMRDRAYPRSRGGTATTEWLTSISPSLSPLARGNRGPGARLLLEGGPIPARAGEPRASLRRTTGNRAYPRSRGGTTSPTIRTFRVRGLSPLARGNLPGQRGGRRERGPIPARAGEPR